MNLVMEKDIETGAIRYFVTTNLGFSTNMKYGKDNPLIYTGDRSSFTGFMVISDEDGNYLFSYAYQNGKRERVYLKTFQERSELKERDAYFGFHIPNESHIRTKSGGYSECSICLGLTIDGVCYWCNVTDLGECYVIADGGTGGSGGGGFPNYCNVCGFEVQYCICGSGPTYMCSFCGSPYCYGECQDGGSGGGGNPPPPPIEYVNVTISAGNGGSVLPDGINQYVKGIQLTITATPSYGYTFNVWGGDAYGITNPIITHTLNGDKQFYASFATVPNTTDSYLNTAFLAALGVVTSSLQSTVYQKFVDRSLITQGGYSTFAIMQDTDGTLVFLYNTSDLSPSMMNGMKLACLHELWHLDRFINGGSHEHNDLVEDANYQSWIDTLFPNFDGATRALLKYSGATNTTSFINLPYFMREEYFYICNNYGFYE
jgi:hypothetical protein